MDLEEVVHEPQLWNRYSYVGNNPLKYSDPDGRERLQPYHFNRKPIPDQGFIEELKTVAVPAAVFGAPIAIAAVAEAGLFAAAAPGLFALAVRATPFLNFLRNWGAAETGQPSAGLPSVAKQLATAERVGSALKSDPTHRAASFGLDAVAKAGQSFELKGGDGVVRTLIQAPGGMNGKAGIFEYMINKAGQVIHQRFIENGVITGRPNQKPPV
jgi:hypothetical protein